MLKKLILLSSVLFSFSMFSETSLEVKDNCITDSEVNFDVSFIPKSSLLDVANFEKDFKNGIECFRPATFAAQGFTKTKYKIGETVYNYENTVDFGQQAFFLNQKIPNNSFLYSHYSIPVLLYKANYLNNEDVSDYYLSFEKSYNDTFNEELKTIYHSPYDFKRIMIHSKKEENGNNVFFYFNSADGSDISDLKKEIEKYFLDIIQKHNLPLKLQNTEELEIMRVYFEGFKNSLNLVEPFIQIFLNHIDYHNLGFKKNLKYEKIDNIYDSNKEVSPLTLFGEHIVISYTFDKKQNSGLIAFSFIEDENMIKKLQLGFKK